MENAARGAAEAVLRLEADATKPILCLAGPGNNGGDAMAVARHLAIARRPVIVALLELGIRKVPRGDAGIQHGIVSAMGLEQHVLRTETAGKKVRELAARADLAVDGLFGTGLDRPLDGLARDVVLELNRATLRIVALDLPSGLDCDTGKPLGACVRACATVSFVAPKLGFAHPGASEWTGDVSIVGIGAPLEWPLRN